MLAIRVGVQTVPANNPALKSRLCQMNAFSRGGVLTVCRYVETSGPNRFEITGLVWLPTDAQVNTAARSTKTFYGS